MRRATTRGRGGVKNTSTTMRMRGPLAIPNRMLTKFRWGQRRVAAGQGRDGYHKIFLNSMFDPDVSLGGNQPPFYDNLLSSSMYTRYRVNAVKYRAYIHNRTAPANNRDLVFVFLVTQNGAAPSALVPDSEDIRSLPGLVKIVRVPYTDKAKRTVSFYLKLPLIWTQLQQIVGGHTQPYAEEESTGALYNASPTSGLFLNVQYYYVDQSAALDQHHDIEEQLTFYAALTDLASGEQVNHD